MNRDKISMAEDWEAAVGRLQPTGPGKRGGGNIFGTMMTAVVAHVDDDGGDGGNGNGEFHSTGSSSDSLLHKDIVLPNGDSYSGQWLDNYPHGNGTYQWTDGCVYLGEWGKGKMMGRGKFSWPSGATYEGDFVSGYMDGNGTYTSSVGDSDTYKGSWLMNLRHGHGIQSYACGDCYEGAWRRGLADGLGRYQWKDANHYVGQWKKGKMNGNGTMVLINGNRYDGFWRDGLPKGNGTFLWSDGSLYVGFWSKDPKEQKGAYYPFGSTASGNLDWNPQDVFLVGLFDCKISNPEKVLTFPSQKMLNLLGTVDQRRMSADVRLSDFSPFSFDGNEVFSENVGVDWRDGEEGYDANVQDENVVETIQKLRMMPMKKQGEMIQKGHKNYELMLSLQLGIRYSVGRPAPAISLDLNASAFDPKEKVSTKFPLEGSKHTPPHQSSDFKWKDYCPSVFRTLRKLFNVDAADYMISICSNGALRELSSPGKSGSFFYLSSDDRYMIKTVKKAEVKVLLRMLPAYYYHVRASENTLVTKFFGLHSVKFTGQNQKKVRFVIMGNLFRSEYAIHRRFDLKGSSHGRTTEKSAIIDPNVTLKDLDLNFMFRLQKAWFREFCRQVARDCDFLEQERIMDYSLLVGLHFREVSYTDTASLPPSPRGNDDLDKETGSSQLSRLDRNQIVLDPERCATIKLGANMPARVEKTVRRSNSGVQLIGEPTGELYEVILFFGIIDILQEYDISKKLEHAYKSMQYDPTSISAVDPRLYSKRFQDFILSVFVDDT